MSGYHGDTHDCVNAISQRLGEVDVDETTFTEAWTALGEVVSVLYRRKSIRSVQAVPAVTARPSQEDVKPQAAPTAPTVYSVCPHCGFESMTTRGTKTHIARMHKERQQFTGRELWERSHAANVPYPGDAAELAAVLP